MEYQVLCSKECAIHILDDLRESTGYISEELGMIYLGHDKDTLYAGILALDDRISFQFFGDAIPLEADAVFGAISRRICDYQDCDTLMPHTNRPDE